MKYEYGIHPNGLVNFSGGSSWGKCNIERSVASGSDGTEVGDHGVKATIDSIAITTKMQSKGKQPRMVTVRKAYDVDSKDWWLL